MTYPEVTQYLESFVNYEKAESYPYKESIKLERIKGFLDTIGNPQDALPIIHVAGSKGKGSTCAFIAYILREAGFKTGLYTSPHLINFRERIRVLSPKSPSHRVTKPPDDFEGMISKPDLVRLVRKLKPSIGRYNKASKYGSLTFFEAYTAMAFVYFKDNDVDFAVLETGLGGRLDATNVSNPLVSVITPISYEHTDKLGNTLAEIASEKAGIIKNSSQLTVISAPQDKEAAEVIRKKCKESGVRLFEVKKPSGFKIRLPGQHQRINAAVAIATIKALAAYNIRVSQAAVKKGLFKTCWPGRCEVVSKNPYIVLDGAQNKASAQALRKTIRENFRYNRLILVLGISSDKDIPGICSVLCNLAGEVILTRADNPRAASPEVLSNYFLDRPRRITASVSEAKKLSGKLARKKDLILVTGSLFVVGEFRNAKN